MPCVRQGEILCPIRRARTWGIPTNQISSEVHARLCMMPWLLLARVSLARRTIQWLRRHSVLKTLPNTIDAHPKFWPNYYAKLCRRKGKTIVSERLLKNNANFFSTLRLTRIFEHEAFVRLSNTFVYHYIDTLACFNEFPKVCRQLLANLLMF